MTDLSSLISRVEKATGPDRELDARIWAYFAGVKYVGHNVPYGDVHGRTQVEYTVPPKRTRMVTNFPQTPHAEPVTTSVDAAISLVERVLPGWGWVVESNTHHIKACLNPEFGDPVGKYPHWAAVSNTSSRKFEDAATPAIALVLATLRALQSQTGEA